MSVKAFDKHLEKEARELIADFETLHLHHSKEIYISDNDSQRRYGTYYSYRRLLMPDATTDNEKKDENFVKFKSTLINFVRVKYNIVVKMLKNEIALRRNKK